VGSGGAPEIGGVAPGVYVDASGDDVPVLMPDEIRLSGGTPFWPVGTDVAEDGTAFVMVPVDMELGDNVVVVEEGTGLVPLLAGGDDDGDGEPVPVKFPCGNERRKQKGSTFHI
jgi:hypothetical protein